MQAKEQKYRTSLLVCDTGNKVLQELFTFHLSKNHGSIAINAFLDQNQHEIFHLYSDSQCCQCSNSPYRHNRLPLRRHQMELIFDEHNKKSCHKTQRRPVAFCCSIAKTTLRINDFDITLLNSVLINLCHDLFWGDCLMHQSLTQFLENNKHAIYHLWHRHGSCCRCTSQNPNNLCLIEYNHWNTLFNKCQSTNGCSIGDACSYTPQLTVTRQNIDNKLSSVLHMHFSDLRKAIDQVVKHRNELSHKPSGNQLPATIFSACETHILVIANHIGAEYENVIREEIAELKSLKLDEDRYHELMDILKEQNDNQEQIVNSLNNHEQILRENVQSKHDRNCQEQKNHQELMTMLGTIYATIKDNNVDSLKLDHMHINIPEEHLQDYQAQQKGSEINQAVGGSSLSWFCAIPFRLYSWLQGTTDSSTEEFISNRYGDPSDTFTCGRCNLFFNDLSEFFAHKKTHEVEEKMVVKTRFSTTGADKNWEESSCNHSRTNRVSVNVDGCKVIGAHTGSLIFLTKISTAMFRTRELFLDLMQNFINNLLQKCPLENDDVTVLEIKIHIEDDFKSDDCFKCGLCNESYNNLAAFILHKESETHQAKKEQVAKQPKINKKEPVIAETGKEVSLVGETHFKQVTHDNTVMPLHSENISGTDVASGIVESSATLPYEEPDIADNGKEESLVDESNFKQVTHDNTELLLHSEHISGTDVSSEIVKSSVTLHYEERPMQKPLMTSERKTKQPTGSSPDIIDTTLILKGGTPLHHVAEKGQTRTLEMLTRNVDKINAKDDMLSTAQLQTRNHFPLAVKCGVCLMKNSNQSAVPVHSILKQMMCVIDCTGMDEDSLNMIPEERHLIRLARLIGREFCQFIIYLGLTKPEWDDIEDNKHYHDRLIQKFVGLVEWKKKQLRRNIAPTFRDLSKALFSINYSKHVLCSIFREEFTEVFALDNPRLQEIPDDSVLEELSTTIGYHTLELGVELGLEIMPIEETMFKFSKDMFSQTFDILIKWKKSCRIQPTVRALMLALQYVDHKGFNFLHEKYLV